MTQNQTIDFSRALKAHQIAIDSVMQSQQKILTLIDQVAKALESGRKVIWLGNGGSAADAQHMAAELMVRYVENRPPLASIALTTDSSILTAHSNDFEFDTVFARQIDALAQEGDVVMALSTSGNSLNVIRAAEAAVRKNCYLVGLTGQNESRLSKLSDLCFQVDSKETARIQEAHTFISHLLCEGLDAKFGAGTN